MLNYEASERGMSRRAFLQASAASAASLAALSAVGCSPENELSETGGDAESEGTWIPVACWHNCGGKCVNKALVKDGVVIRQKTDDAVVDGENGHFQNRSCQRGHSQQQQCFNVDRLKYPMKRKNWQPGGQEINGHLRGIDEWERVSWDEALDMIASETMRIYDSYGPASMLMANYSTKPYSSIFGELGGFSATDCTDSYGTWCFSPSALGIPLSKYANPDTEAVNDRFDLPNAETIVLFGANPSWASGGSPSYHFLKAKEAGTKYVYVGASRNISASMLDARWIPVRPGTDTAFLLAVAYCMIQDEEDLVDKEFLHKYCVGYDAESMPDDAVLDENFRSYVLGEYDGVPKTPDWGSEICGASVEDIQWLAEAIGKNHDVMLLHSFAGSRCNGAENLPQLFLTVGCMGGHIGRSGNATGGVYHYDAGNSGPALVSCGSALSYTGAAVSHELIPGPQLWNAVTDGYYQKVGGAVVAAPYFTPQPAECRQVDIRMIFTGANNFLQSRMNVNGGIKAFRKVDFVLATDYKLSLSCQYADIVLPVATLWEGYAYVNATTWVNRENIVLHLPVMDEPLYEAKSDEWIGRELCKKLGLDGEKLIPSTDKQNFFKIVSGATYFAGGDLFGTQDALKFKTAIASGDTSVDTSLFTEEWKTLVTITQEDIDSYGDVDAEPQEGIIGFKEILANGGFQVEVEGHDDRRWIGYKRFIDDPETYPLPSVSGKFEIYCQTKADAYNTMGINPEPIKPYANYIVPNDGYEQTFSDWENKVKGEYPYQVYTPHYARRSHTTLDNLPWLQEAFENPVYINAGDAEENGIQTGDTVLVTSEYGQILRTASVIHSVMPGCIGVPHGARTDIDEETGIDYGGNENTLTGPGRPNYLPYLGSFNSCLVKIEKWSGESILHDYEKTFVPAGIE